MQDLGIDTKVVISWFVETKGSTYTLVNVLEEHATSWISVLALPVRRCYINDEVLNRRAETTGSSKADLIAAKLPERGPTMAGDFGEILVFLYHAAVNSNVEVIGPKKWRLKQDRTKPIPHSDVVQFVLPHWPNPSEEDRILCSEVKTKSTPGTSTPISSAIEDSKKDRTSRLAKTLAWLKDRALHEDLGTTTIAHLERFAKSTDYPEAHKHFYAVAVVCASLLDNELQSAPAEESTDFTVVVIAVPDLKNRYETVFDAVHSTAAVREGDP